MSLTALRRLTLTDFRSYERLDLGLDPGVIALFGPNGAGKTNLLEAVSLFAPGRGLRNARAADVARRAPADAHGRGWAVAARLEGPLGTTTIGTGMDPDAARRTVRLDGETAPPARLGERVRMVWLTPLQDRLFLEGASERRRFLDRLTLAAEPSHATTAAAFDRAMRERLRLLTEGPDDRDWLAALERQAGETGAALASARRRTLLRLQTEIRARADRPFPQARLDLSDAWGREPADQERLRAALETGRERDRAAGRALVGPQRTDLIVIHAEKERPAAECSTGEQKAMILNIVLAQASALARRRGMDAESPPSPILLLDEVAAHLDASRRAALFDEIVALGLQAFLTGTDRMLFAELEGRAQILHVDRSSVSF